MELKAAIEDGTVASPMVVWEQMNDEIEKLKAFSIEQDELITAIRSDLLDVGPWEGEEQYEDRINEGKDANNA